jgi:hypothetical protein
MVTCIAYVLCSGIAGQADLLAWIAIGLVFFEGFVLLLNGWVCPLRRLAERRIPDLAPGADIYIPTWLMFKGYKILFSLIFAVGVLLVTKNQFWISPQ